MLETEFAPAEVYEQQTAEQPSENAYWLKPRGEFKRLDANAIYKGLQALYIRGEGKDRIFARVEGNENDHPVVTEILYQGPDVAAQRDELKVGDEIHDDMRNFYHVEEKVQKEVSAAEASKEDLEYFRELGDSVAQVRALEATIRRQVEEQVEKYNNAVRALRVARISRKISPEEESKYHQLLKKSMKDMFGDQAGEIEAMSTRLEKYSAAGIFPESEEKDESK